MPIPVSGLQGFRSRRASRWSNALLPRAYPYNTSYPIQPNSARILPPVNDSQAADPRSSGGAGAATWQVTGRLDATDNAIVSPGAMTAPGDNIKGLSISNLVVAAALGVAVWILFFRGK